MRSILTLCILLMAAPALAQTGSACRGKTTFQLSDGITGCIVEIEEGTVTSTRSVDNIQRSSKNSKAARVSLAMYGPFPSRYVAVPRTMTAACRAIQPTVVKAMGAEGFDVITLIATWPDSNATFRAAGTGQTTSPPRVAGFANAKCRNFKFFGRRER